MRKKSARKRRNLVVTILMMISGLFIIFWGFAVFLISFPLMFILIGFFTLPGSIFIMIFGWVLFRDSIYKENGKSKIVKQRIRA